MAAKLYRMKMLLKYTINQHNDLKEDSEPRLIKNRGSLHNNLAINFLTIQAI
ncbi:MAG: hypothetical protein A4E54_01844 [Pelotomaculum sp. PtaB.Bin117]|nr:MAG: hypothetical protein A4E54_01844 [Pelotomaculum sp. PtaB.Bin117]